MLSLYRTVRTHVFVHDTTYTQIVNSDKFVNFLCEFGNESAFNTCALYSAIVLNEICQKHEPNRNATCGNRFWSLYGADDGVAIQFRVQNVQKIFFQWVFPERSKKVEIPNSDNFGVKFQFSRNSKFVRSIHFIMDYVLNCQLERIV